MLRLRQIECNQGEPGEIHEWVDRKSGTGLPYKKDFEAFDFFTMWEKQLADSEVVVVDDTSYIRNINKEVYDKVLAGTISRYIIATIRDKEEVIGYLIADNYALNQDINLREVFETVSIFISEELRNYTIANEMNYMSAHDVLTDLNNRNSFSSTLHMMEGMDISVGICFIDINGLKAVNDSEGHEAGDLLIQEAGAIIASVFKKKYCYRIGGDEFVAIVPQIEETHFSELIEKLRKKTKKVSFAIGSVWRNKAEGLEDLVTLADKLMYSDKAEYYSNSNDRRH